MSDAPERILAWPSEYKAQRVSLSGGPPDRAVEYVRADLVPAPSVTVKPLEWRDDDEEQGYCLSVCGAYLVELSHDGNWYYWDNPSPFATLDAAKAAAQADYEARILAAIQIGPHRATPEALASLRAGEGFATSGAEDRWIEDMKAGVYDEDMPAPGWQTIESAPVGIPVLAYCYGGEVLMTRINKNREDEYARMPDLWMPLPAPPSEGVEP